MTVTLLTRETLPGENAILTNSILRGFILCYERDGARGQSPPGGDVADAPAAVYGAFGPLRRPRLALCFRFRRKEVALRGAGPEGGRGRQTVSLLLAGEPDGGSAFPAT